MSSPDNDGDVLEPVLERLQRQSDVPRWSLVSEELVSSIVNGHEAQFGPKGRMLRKVISVSDVAGSAWFVIATVSTYVAISLWFKALVTANHNLQPRRAFVGFGAGSEEALWSEFNDKPSAPAVRLNQINLAGFSNFLSARFKRVISLSWSNAVALPRMVANSIPELQARRLDVLTNVGMRLGEYAFHRAFWEAQPREHIHEVAFTSTDVSACACVDAGHAATFLQHGLLSRNLLFPRFESIETLTTDEAVYLASLLPDTTISTVRSSEIPVSKLTNKILIVARWRHDQEDVENIQRLIEWARHRNLELIVRLHPASDSAFWAERFPELDVVDVDEAIVTILRRVRPKLIVSWYSTVLAEALRMRLIPVTLAGKDTELMRNLVYPLYRRTLHWPDDSDELNAIVKGKLNYDAVVSTLADSHQIASL